MPRIALFFEGETELALTPFLHRWLDPQLAVRVGLAAVTFQGSSNYLDDVAAKTEIYLDHGKVNAVVGLIDLYGLPPDRIDLTKFATVTDKVKAARAYIRGLIPGPLQPYFRQHFAVHETEAWLLAYPDEWPAQIRSTITKRPPEEIDFDEPPARLLKRLLGE